MAGDAAAAPLAKVATAAYWRALCPALHCEDAAYESATVPLECVAQAALCGTLLRCCALPAAAPWLQQLSPRRVRACVARATLAPPEPPSPTCQSPHAASRRRRLAEKTLSGAKARLLDEGFTHVSAAKLRWGTQPAACAAAVEALKAAGWPPPFLLAFDELWALQRQAAPLLAAASGGNVPCGDALVWHVAPADGDAGFSPHRDRQPQDVPVRPDLRAGA